MNECEMLHETVVRDIIDISDAVKNTDQIEWLQRKNRTGSIAKRASNLVLVFPVIVSNSLSIETATLISKAIERKCVSLLRILFSSVQYSRGVENMEDYVKLFHSNLNAKMSLDDFITQMDKLTESGEMTIIDKESYDAVMADMRNINFAINENYNEVSINDYKVRRNPYDGSSYVVCEAKRSEKDQQRMDRLWNSFDKSFGDRLDRRAGEAAEKAFNKNFSKMNQAKTNVKDEVDYFKNQLLPQDVVKANELEPTLVMVKFTSVADGVKYTTDGIVGVKAKMYPVDSMDIIYRITGKIKDKNGLFNLVRATTREISFFKDLAFAIDKAKLDAINMSKESNNAKMFKLLERRAAKNKFMTMVRRNDASPITTLVMSQDEVEYLKKYNNIDMDKSVNTRTILTNYNLMAIVIADESLEVAKFLFDDDEGVYESISFDGLERDAKDNSYKKVINLMSKINR